MEKRIEDRLLKKQSKYYRPYLDALYDCLEFSVNFKDIKDFRRWLERYHDLLVDLHNLGVDKVDFENGIKDREIEFKKKGNVLIYSFKKDER